MKKAVSIVLALCLLAVLAGCGGPGQSAAPSAPVASAPSSSVPPTSAPSHPAAAAVRVAGLKGPTSMGMVKLMQEAEEGTAAGNYQFEMFGAADEVNTRLIQGEIDVAAVPANVASVLYNRTQGKIRVAAINTLGVLYVMDTGETVQSVEDLRGKTIYSTGKGQTPEYVLNYILSENGIDPTADVNIEYKSEPTEVAAMLNAGADAIAVLPQPFATAVQMQNDTVRIALDLTQEWDKIAQDSALVTGVLVVREEFVQQNPEDFAAFLQAYENSINWVNANTEQAAELVAKFGIVEKAPIAQKALPLCNITYVGGEEMRTMLQGYLQVLLAQNPEAVGGKLPEDDFYIVG